MLPASETKGVQAPEAKQVTTQSVSADIEYEVAMFDRWSDMPQGVESSTQISVATAELQTGRWWVGMYTQNEGCPDACKKRIMFSSSAGFVTRFTMFRTFKIEKGKV